MEQPVEGVVLRDLARIRSPGGRPRSALLRAVLASGGRLRPLLLRPVPVEWRFRLEQRLQDLTKAPYPSSASDGATLAALQRRPEPDVRRLEQVLQPSLRGAWF